MPPRLENRYGSRRRRYNEGEDRCRQNTSAEIITHDRLVVGVAGETFHPRSDLNHQTFLRITNGIPRSRAKPARIKAFYAAGRDGRLIAA